MKTLTEKYRGVLNETFNKTQFVRDARMAWPNLISQFNGFEDTVSILKTKGMISDAKKAEEKPHNLSDEAIRRGTDFEIEAMGRMSQDKVSEEDQGKAKEKAISNLLKDPLHYLNLLSGESSKVDKHDKPVEVKKGNEVDTFNGMKKADLKENYTKEKLLRKLGDADDAMIQTGNGREYVIYNPNSNNDDNADMWKDTSVFALDQDGEEHEIDYEDIGLVMVEDLAEADAIPTEPGVPGERASNHDRKMAMRKIIDFLTIVGHPDSGYKVGNQEAIDFLKTHKDDIFNGDIDFNDINDVWSNYDEYETINTDIPEVMGVDRKGNKQPETGGSDAVKYKAAARDVKQEAMSDQQMKDIEKYGQEDKVVKAFKPGDMFSKEFDYEGMLEYGLKVRLNTPLQTLQALFDSFEDVNYHSEGSHLSYAIDSIKEKDKAEALDHLRNFKKAIKKTLVSFNEGVNPDRRELEEAEAVIDEGRGDLDTIVRVVTDMANEDGITTKEAALEVIEALRHAYRIDAHDEGVNEAGNETNFNPKEIKSVSFTNGLKVTVGEPHPEEEGIVNFIRKGENGYEIGFTDGSEGGSYRVDFDGEFLDEDDYIEEDAESIKPFYGTDREMDDEKAERDFIDGDGMEEKKGIDHDEEILSYIADTYIQNAKDGDKAYAGFLDLNIRDAVQDVVGILQDRKHPLYRETRKEYKIVSRDKAKGLFEKKGKDHDGDGDVDKDDYMAAKDAAIKKSMGKDKIVKENIKAIISKVLEEQVINEAATNELAKFADQYGGFEGMKAAIIQLQDVVTDIEAYYDKTRTKIQKVYNTLGDIRNEEGLKVGGFLAPSIESAFNKDLRPVTKVGFTKGLDQPKVKVISQRDIDRNDMGSPNLGELYTVE